MKHLPNKQQGFTLLELLVVITLLAVLSVGALVAYEGVGENAEATASANSNVTLDRAIRTYRSVTGAYPNQWDSLSTTSGVSISTLPVAASAIFGNLTVPAASEAAIIAALEEVGIDELQFMGGDLPDGVAPNRAHNESVAGSNATEVDLEVDGLTNISIVASGGAAGTCQLGTTDLNTPFNGTAVTNNSILNALNDSLEDDECHLVVALGFGSDAAASTTDSSVAISQAPTYTRAGSVNPSTQYARFVGLFHVGETNDAGTAVTIRDTARLIAVITPDGRVIDDALAEANAN